MAKPLYVLAGQSNAAAMIEAIRFQLTLSHGSGNFELIDVTAPGAPLTYKRPSEDWYSQNELQLDLVGKVEAELKSSIDGRLAGLMWVHGEGDTHDVARPTDYPELFLDLITDFESGLQARLPNRDTGVADMPISMLGLSEYAQPSQSRSNWDIVKHAIESVAKIDERLNFIDPDLVAAAAGIDSARLFRDGIHYTYEMQLHLSGILLQSLSDPPSIQTGSELDDLLFGTANADVLQGGLGNDTYVINHEGDRIVEVNGQGEDQVLSKISISLPKIGMNIERVKLFGSSDAFVNGDKRGNEIIGNSADNIINGRGGSDHLVGGAGKDTLSGGAGHDYLAGGKGNDVYIIGDMTDVVIEFGREGWDTVRASTDYSLQKHALHVEKLKLIGRNDLSGTGNSKKNTVTGNTSDNKLFGKAGNDELAGRKGDDVLVGGRGNDVLSGGKGADVFVFRQKSGTDEILDFDLVIDKIDAPPHILPGDIAVCETGIGTKVVFEEDHSVLLIDVFLGTTKLQDLFM